MDDVHMVVMKTFHGRGRIDYSGKGGNSLEWAKERK
jgi:hypothetical protein